MKENDRDELVQILGRPFQFVAEMTKEHQKDYDEILAYLWVSDLTRGIRAEIEAANAADREALSRSLLAHLSVGIEVVLARRNPEWNELIIVGLFESIGNLGEYQGVLIEQLGPLGKAAFLNSDNFS